MKEDNFAKADKEYTRQLYRMVFKALVLIGGAIGHIYLFFYDWKVGLSVFFIAWMSNYQKNKDG